MERKYKVLVCCLALLLLGGISFAGTTPWPKFNYASFAGVHYYINAPNGLGLNGEGDSALELYLSTDFGPGVTIAGLNIEAYDWNGGVSMFTFKACEMRAENPVTPGCPDYAGFPLALVFPVPYISNWPNVQQYAFTTPIPYPAGLNTIACVQYTPGQNILTTGCPLVGGDGGPGSGFGYFWDAALASCAGPMTLDWLLCYYGNAPEPEVLIDHTLVNNKYGTDSDTTGMAFGNGFDVILQLKNSGGTDWVGGWSWWMRVGTSGYSGFSGTGLDIIRVLFGPGKLSPIPFLIPANFTFTATLGFTPYISSMADWGFAAYTSEINIAGGTVNKTDTEDACFYMFGVQDDNLLDISYYVQSPQQWGDGMCKRMANDNLPSGSFNIFAVDWSPGDFGATSCPAVYKAEIRTEDALYGMGTPDLSIGGLLGTYDPATTAPGGFVRRTVYAYPGGGPIGLTAPTGNIYTRCLFDLSDPGYLVAIGSSTGDSNHKSFRDSSFSSGNDPNGGPDGEGLPFNIFSAQLMMRLAITDVFNGGGTTNGTVSQAHPTVALAQ
jgi:hypothetical protein